MATIVHSPAVDVDGIEARAYKIPTATETAVHLEYFFDHHRIERIVFASLIRASTGGEA
jgi:hypothetical protein